jgi:type I restriction enzyme S subunit
LGWTEVALGELIELKRGYDLPARGRRPGSVPVVSSRGVIGRHDTARVDGPGVVTGRTGTLGGVFLVESDFWPLNTTLYVRDFKGNDPRFVAHLLRTLDIEAHNDKAAIPGVSRDQLHDLPVPRPPLRRQREIAERLALFDLRGALLEELERALAGITHALHASLPRGRPMPVEALCAAIGNGATPRRAEAAFWRSGTIPWFKSGELDDGPLTESEETITAGALNRTPRRLWPAGSVLLAMYASPTVGRLGLLQVPAAANQACCALIARPEIGGPFLFHALLATRGRLERLAGGAAQQNINQAIVREHEVEVPAERDLSAFNARASRLHALRAVHGRERDLLRSWRDTLRDALLNP